MILEKIEQMKLCAALNILKYQKFIKHAKYQKADTSSSVQNNCTYAIESSMKGAKERT